MKFSTKIGFYFFIWEDSFKIILVFKTLC